MAARTPTEAIIAFVEPIQKALNYIAVGRLTFGRTGTGHRRSLIQVISLNEGAAVPLSAPFHPSISLSTSLWVRVREYSGNAEPYSCEVVTYWHTFGSVGNNEILAFHWAPDAAGNARTFPHVHIGHMISGRGAFASDRFHKLHIPTGFVPVEAIVRFAIEELGVEVRRGFDRAAVLADLAGTLD